MSAIKPILKGEKMKDVRNYKEFSTDILLTLLYRKNGGRVGQKNIIVDLKPEFRKGRNYHGQPVYFKLYTYSRERNDKIWWKVFVLFADPTTSYDTVHREILLRLMRTKGLKEQIVRWIEVVYKETENILTVNDMKIVKFPITKASRKGLPC